MNSTNVEADILYQALVRLTASSKPLKAISDYAVSLGAARGLLIEAQPQVRLVEEWAAPGLHSLGPDGDGLAGQPDDESPEFLTSIRQANGAFIHYEALARLPLLTGGRIIGWLVYLWDEPHPFGEDECRILTALAEQSAPVLNLLWSLNSAQRKVIEMQMAKRESEILRSASNQLSQATDAVGLLEAVSAYPRLTGASVGRLAYYDGGELRTVAMWQKGVPSHEVAGEPLELEAATAGDDDVILLDARYSTSTGSRAVLHLTGRGAWMGTLVFDWEQTNYFNERDRYLYQALAQQISAVIDSIQLFEQINFRAHELATVAQISAIISSILDENLLLEKVAEVTRESFPDYRILIYLMVNNLLVRIPPQQKGNRPPSYTTYRLQLSQMDSLIAEAARTRQMQVVDDITADSDYKLLPLMSDARSELAIPMVMGDEVIGVVDVQAAAVGRFSEPDARVLKTLVDMIAVAIQNARLYDQARQLAVAEERNRLARELHDSVSQALYGIVLGANTSNALLKAKQYDQLEGSVSYVLSLAKAGLDEIRASIFDLRPVVLQDQGLIQAITSQANALQIRHGIRVNVALCAEPDLPFKIKEEVYRIAREGLHNIVKHAQATEVSLSLACDNETIQLYIEDNGVGFDPLKPSNSLGLKSMRERAASLKGTLSIESAPGAGSRITAAIPVQR
jgi:signal transduction histidine kinase